MFGPISGPAGGLVGAGQMLVAPWKHRLSWKTWWRVRHAATVTQAASNGYVPEGTMAAGFEYGHISGGPRISQAMPSGYEEVEIGAGHWTADYVYIRPPYRDGQADMVAGFAREMASRKIPYSFADYAAIAAHRLNVPVPHLDAYIARHDADGYPIRSMCSQGVDAQLTLSGGFGPDGKVFDDGRLSQDVVPSELYLLLLAMPEAVIMRPGTFVAESTGSLASVPKSLL